MSYVKPRSNINRKKNMYGWNEEEKEKIFFICFKGGKGRNDESKPVRKMVVLEPSP